jgi:hypothetical protein
LIVWRKTNWSVQTLIVLLAYSQKNCCSLAELPFDSARLALKKYWLKTGDTAKLHWVIRHKAVTSEEALLLLLLLLLSERETIFLAEKWFFSKHTRGSFSTVRVTLKGAGKSPSVARLCTYSYVHSTATAS